MHRAARAAVIISLATLLSRVLGFVRETVMAAVFGATVTADAYLVAQTVPLMLSGVATAVGGSVLLPAVARLSARDPERADRVAATVLLGMAVCLLLATAATWILAPWVVAAV
ncbi:MAG: hypothetical protein IRY95_10050, partial [Clostridia bacterium]|nr:hypothetical protein [Clostridia bacterium]